MARNQRHAPAQGPRLSFQKLKNNMAAEKEAKKQSSSLSVDYRQLNDFSLATLYDSVSSRKRGRLYKVERVIMQRNIRQVSIIDAFNFK